MRANVWTPVISGWEEGKERLPLVYSLSCVLTCVSGKTR